MSYLGMIEPLNQRKNEMFLTGRWTAGAQWRLLLLKLQKKANANATPKVTMSVNPVIYLCLEPSCEYSSPQVGPLNFSNTFFSHLLNGFIIFRVTGRVHSG